MIRRPSATPRTGAIATMATHRFVSRVDARLAASMLTTEIPSLNRWTTTTDRDDEAEAAADDEAGRERDPVEEAVDAHPGGADDPDMAVGRLAVIEFGGRLVADVDGRQLLDDVERQEPDRGREHHLVHRAAEQFGRLRDQVEERRPDPDPGPDRDDHPDLLDGAQGDVPAEEGRDERRRRRRGTRSAASVAPASAQAGRTQPEQLEAVLVDAVAGLAGDSRTTVRRPASSISVVRPQREQTT